MKKILLNPLWGLVALAVLVYAFASQPKYLESIKLRYFDQLIVSKPEKVNNIFTVTIDEAALEQYGQYPFPRNVYAQIIQDLYAKGAGLVVWNIMMPEQDRFGGDKALAETLAEYPVIVPYRPDVKTKNTPINPGAAIIGSENLGVLGQYPGITANVPSIDKNAAGHGIVNTEPEIDGVVRRLTTVAVVKDVLYPSLALEVLRIAAGDPNFQIKLNEFGIEKMRIPQFGPISTDQQGRIWIDWTQKSNTMSLADLKDWKTFEGAVVIVDVTAPGIANPVPTALGAVYPGDVQAAVIGTLFNGTNIQRPDWAPSAEIVLLIAGGLLIVLLSRWTYIGLGFTVLLIGSVIPVSWYAYQNYMYLLDVTAPMITFVLVALKVYGIKFIREFLEKQAIKKQFSGYCSKEVVEMLQKNPDLIKKGIKKDVSVMFSDLRGFTPIGEYYGENVAGLTQYMNGYMDTITNPILANKGMVIKYVGDASMHIHGAPIEDSRHAYTIVKTGLQMLDAVDAYTEQAEAKGLPPAAMGFGINTGEGFIGEMGSSARHNYDILGDMVSTAARLEARCKAYGVLCIIGAETYNRTKDDFFYLYLDNLQPKGKTVADNIYTALRVKGTNYEEARITHDKMHALYKERQFDAAAILCGELIGEFDGQMNKYYRMWFDRCALIKTMKLDDDWNGEWIANEK